MTQFLRDTAVPDVILVKPARYGDARGWFSEVYKEDQYKRGGITCNFVQDNHSMSAPIGVLRGLHFQSLPVPQDKLVRCTRGRVLDVAVDIRHGSPTFGQSVSVELSAENGWQLFVPIGFAHGFCTLEEDTEVQYKVSGPYSPECDGGVAFDDPDIAVNWPIEDKYLILSDKDKQQPRLADLGVIFKYDRSD